MDRRSLSIVAVLLCALAAAGCGRKRMTITPPLRIVETVRVEVPVPVQLAVPAELLAPAAPAELPVFVPPADPLASSALTAEGERQLRGLINDLLTRLAAWRAWATVAP